MTVKVFVIFYKKKKKKVIPKLRLWNTCEIKMFNTKIQLF
jgi:hypothetical protein